MKVKTIICFHVFFCMMIVMSITGVQAQQGHAIKSDIESLSLKAQSQNHTIDFGLDQALNLKRFNGDTAIYQIQNQSTLPKYKSYRRAGLHFAIHGALPLFVSMGTLFVYRPSLHPGNDDRIWNLMGISFLYGSTIGPSAGSLYAEDYKRGLGGIMVRSIAWTTIFVKPGSEESIQSAALIVILASATYNLFTTKKSVNEYNKRVNAQLTPAIDKTTGTVGVRVLMNF